MGAWFWSFKFSLKYLHLSNDSFFLFLSGCLASLASLSFLSAAFSTQWDSWQVSPMHCWPLVPLEGCSLHRCGWELVFHFSSCCFFGPKLLLFMLKSTIIARLTSCLLPTNWRAVVLLQTKPCALHEKYQREVRMWCCSNPLWKLLYVFTK